MRSRQTQRVISLLVVLVLAGAGVALVRAAQTPDDAPRRGAWQPADEDRSAYRDIIDFNIFRSDRRRLAEKVDRDRNPPPPKSTTPRETVDKDPEAPRDPDADWRVAGITHSPEGPVVFMENTASAESVRLDGPGAFASGEITDIGYDKVVYAVHSESRAINVGQTLLGQRSVVSSAPKTTGSSKGGGSAADRLKALREKRARELGGPPPPVPGQEQQDAQEPQDAQDPGDTDPFEQEPSEDDQDRDDQPQARASDQP